MSFGQLVQSDILRQKRKNGFANIFRGLLSKRINLHAP